MAQGFQNIFPNSQATCYTQITPSEQDLACQSYPYFVASGADQAFSSDLLPQSYQPQNYHYENGCQYRNQQPSPYYTMQNNTQQIHTPLQLNTVPPSNQRVGLIQRQKNRIVPNPSFEVSNKRLRMDEQFQMHNTHMYQTNTEAIPKMVYQQRSQLTQTQALPVDTPYPLSGKHPLETQSNGHSSPSRSPILNISTSPNNAVRGSHEELKYPNRMQRVSVDPQAQAYYRTTENSHMPLFLSANQPESTSSGLSPPNPVRTPEHHEIVDTILITDEDDANSHETPEIVIVSVKSPTVPRPDQAHSPALSSPQVLFEEPEVDIGYGQDLLTVGPVQPHVPIQNLQRPTILPFSAPIEPNQYFAQERDYQPQQAPVTSYMNQMPPPFYLAFPPQTESYPTSFYPRTCMPNQFYTCPQPMMTRAPMQSNFRRGVRPYEIPTVYSPVPFHGPMGHFHDIPPVYEETPRVIPHPVPHPHRSKRPGMTRAELKRLEIRKYKMADYEEKDESCVICMDEYKEGEKLFVLPCKHEYHRDCVKDWLVKQRNCPLCRKEVYPK